MLEAHIRAGGGRFRGIRHAAAWDAERSGPQLAHESRPPGLLGDARFRARLRRAGAARPLASTPGCYHPQIAELTALARAFPDTTIVLDHVGGPLGIGPYAGQRDEVFAAWTAASASWPTART